MNHNCKCGGRILRDTALPEVTLRQADGTLKKFARFRCPKCKRRYKQGLRVAKGK